MEPHEKSFIAIIGDIQKSKEIKDRGTAQENLRNTLKRINEKYAAEIASSFVITLGDEFQGLLKKPGSILAMVTEIERKMYPINIRFGLGIGRISTSINREEAIGADGPGYHEARKAIDNLKRIEKRQQVSTTDMRIEIEGNQPIIIDLINTSFSLISAVKRSWTRRQREIIWSMMDNQDTQVEEAKRWGITQPSLQKILSAGEYHAYINAINSLETALGYVEVEDV